MKRWVLYSDDFGAFLLIDMDNRGAIKFVETAAEATVYDERDSERTKIRYFSVVTGAGWRRVDLEAA